MKYIFMESEQALVKRSKRRKFSYREKRKKGTKKRKRKAGRKHHFSLGEHSS